MDALIGTKGPGNPVEFIHASLDQLHGAISVAESDGYTVTVSIEPNTHLGTIVGPAQSGRVFISVEKRLQARRRDAPAGDPTEGGG